MHWRRNLSFIAIGMTMGVASLSTACGQANASRASSPAVPLTAAGLFRATTSLPMRQQRALFSRVDALTISQYYQILVAYADNETVTIDGLQLRRTADILRGERAAILALDAQYANIGALRIARGTEDLVPTLAAFREALQAATQPLGLVAWSATACQSAGRVWVKRPPDARHLNAYNALKDLGVNRETVGKALNRYQTNADWFKDDWGKLVTNGNLQYVQDDPFGRPVVVTGHPVHDDAPSAITALRAGGRPAPAETITSLAYDCFEPEAN